MTAPPEPAEPAPASEAPAVIHLPDRRQPTKKVTSGSENRRRTTAVRVRLHPADAERLKLEAAEAGMSVAGYLASGRLGEEAAPRPRLHRRRVAADVAALLQALVDFSRANNNLNQIAHTGNAMMLFAEEHGAARLAQTACDLVRAVEAVRGDFAPVLAAIHTALADEREG